MNTSSELEQSGRVNRREAIRRLSVLLGGTAFVDGSALVAAVEKLSAAVEGTPVAFNAAEIAFLDEIAETILPATTTPGAKAAKTGAFMALMVSDCYSPAQRKIFREGLQKVDDASKQMNGVSFMAATAQQRLAVLHTLDLEQKRIMDAREAADRKKKGLAPLTGAPVAAPEVDIKAPAHYFRMMKELALLGFFTSEIGCTQALRYVESPGRFDPCIPYRPGEPAWAAHA